MKNSRFKFEYRKNASKLHRTVGDILRDSSTFNNYEIYQEYPVNRINENYPHASHHFDWAIPKLNIVIECHGVQHYKVVRFGGTAEEAITAFKETQRRDKLKKEAAQLAGFAYVEIPYYLEKKVTEAQILELFDKAKEETKVYLEIHKEEIEAYEKAKVQVLVEELAERKKQYERNLYEEYKCSKQYQQQLRKAREYRQKRYRKLKELKNDN